MSKRDERLAAKYKAKGKESATERARRVSAERQSRDTAPTTGMSTMDAMRSLISAPRSEESRRLGRQSRSSASDNGGGESFADRDAKSTTGWFRRGR